MQVITRNTHITYRKHANNISNYILRFNQAEFNLIPKNASIFSFCPKKNKIFIQTKSIYC